MDAADCSGLASRSRARPRYDSAFSGADMTHSQEGAPSAKIERLEGTEWQKSRSFCPAVITEGGRIVWLAGQTTVTDLNGADISGDFEAQARTVFQLIERTLQRAGATLSNLVTMTAFIDDPRNGDRFVQ